MPGVSLRSLLGAGLAVAVAGSAAAQTTTLRFARQLGLGYLQFYVLQDQKIIEREGRAAGMGEIRTVWHPLGTPTAISDSLLSGSVDVIGVGLPSFLTLWDKTKGEVKAVVAMNREPAFLNTRKPGIASLRDYGDDDRIALPAPKVSVQAIMLEMMAEKTFGRGKHDLLDRLTVGMSHPDGLAAMTAGNFEITSHFTAPPYQYQELDLPGVHTVMSSYDATEGPNTFSVIATTSRWRAANPRLYALLMVAISEANEFIDAHPRETAEIFLKIENAKYPADFIERQISSPEFSYDATPKNVMRIYGFMQRVGSLKAMPKTWRELFFPELGEVEGS